MADKVWAGLDTAAYPGDDWARRVYEDTNIWYLGYYLGGANAAPGTETWNGTRPFLEKLGFGFLPIYVGQQADGKRFHDDLTAARGHNDAQDAARKLRSNGFPIKTVCYLDVEDRTVTHPLVTYAASWIGTIKGLGFRAGLYCDATRGGVADAVAEKVGWDAFRLWAVPVGTEIWVKVHPHAHPNGYQTYPTHDPADYHAKAFGVQYAEAGFSDDPPEVFGVQVDLNSFPVKDPSTPEKAPDPGPPEPASHGGRPTADDLVAACYEVLGAPYRVWHAGNSIPMWLDDGHKDGAPPASYIKRVGVECSDLINYGLQRLGLPPAGGTGNFLDSLTHVGEFSPHTPGVPGAACLRPFMGAGVGQQGHVALYVPEGHGKKGTNRLIQSLIFENQKPRPGVTDAYTDAQTYSWGLDTAFTKYGLITGIDYSKYL